MIGNYVSNSHVLPGQVSSQYSIVTLAPGAQILDAKLYVNTNADDVSFDILVNGVDVTALLKGPWSGSPITLDLAAVASPDAHNQMYVQLKSNDTAFTQLFSWQLLINVVR